MSGIPFATCSPKQLCRRGSSLGFAGRRFSEPVNAGNDNHFSKTPGGRNYETNLPGVTELGVVWLVPSSEWSSWAHLTSMDSTPLTVTAGCFAYFLPFSKSKHTGSRLFLVSGTL